MTEELIDKKDEEDTDRLDDKATTNNVDNKTSSIDIFGKIVKDSTENLVVGATEALTNIKEELDIKAQFRLKFRRLKELQEFEEEAVKMGMI